MSEYSAVLNNNKNVDFMTDHYREILKILLKDKTTGGNIIWATDNYASLGEMYGFDKPILLELITGDNTGVVRPRVKKSKEEQAARIHNKGEVFTPAWVCNLQNNYLDDLWFGYKAAFNKRIDRTWETNRTPVKFPGANGENWEDYIYYTVLEITCGEAPYLVSRYDAATGEAIKLEDRIGRLDRKFRVINENVDIRDRQGWLDWAVKAVKSVYGYEWQGDSLLLARENILYTFIEYYNARFGGVPDFDILKEIADIITWNLWQMDGLKAVIPKSCKTFEIVETLLGTETRLCKCVGCEKRDIRKHNGIYSMTMNWVTGTPERYVDSIRDVDSYVAQIGKK